MTIETASWQYPQDPSFEGGNFGPSRDIRQEFDASITLPDGRRVPAIVQEFVEYPAPEIRTVQIPQAQQVLQPQNEWGRTAEPQSVPRGREEQPRESGMQLRDLRNNLHNPVPKGARRVGWWATKNALGYVVIPAAGAYYATGYAIDKVGDMITGIF